MKNFRVDFESKNSPSFRSIRRQGNPKKTGLFSMPTWWPGSLQSNIHRPISVEETEYKEIPIWILAGFCGVWGRL